MKLFTSKTSRLIPGLSALVLLLSANASQAQATVNITAASTSTTLPDGQIVPMWGYSCNDAGTGATCAASNPAVQSKAIAGWSPIVITVPYNTGGPTTLTINLTNSLPVPPGNSASAGIPTSLIIAGQIGGGLGGPGTRSQSPAHATQGVTWFIPGSAATGSPGITLSSGGSGYAYSPSVTFSGGGGTGATAVATTTNGVVTAITLTNTGSGYTSAPTITISGGGGSGASAQVTDLTAFTSASPNPTATPPAQLSRVQSFGTEVATGATTTLSWNNLRPGTYLIESGTHPSIQAPMGLYGVLIVTQPANTTTGAPAQAYPGTGPTQNASVYDADVAALLSEIDPVQNAAVDTAVHTTGFSETRVWSGQPGGCGNATSSTYNTCYPPAVNYSPRYYLINGVSFDRTNLAASTAAILPLDATQTPPASPAATTGNVVLRLVNAGLRMHVPSAVNLPMTLIAEDGNPLPGQTRLQNEVFLPAGKTYDVVVKPSRTTGTTSTYSSATYALFDRQLSLSTNNQRNGGMQAYISVAGGAASGAGSTASAVSLKNAAAKTYYCVSGTPLAVTDPLLGLLGGVTGANGVVVGAQTLPAGASLSVQSDGTFAYSPPATGACGGSFTFIVNNNATNTYTATISECDATPNSTSGCPIGGAPTIFGDNFTTNNAKVLTINPPGVLANDSDPSGLPLTVDATTIPAAASVGLTSLTVSPDGGITAVAPAAGTYTFTYNVKNSKLQSAASTATVQLTFQAGSGLKVKLVDQKVPTREITDYRWIIEEDRTFWIDPKCQVNANPRPNDSYGRPCPPTPVESLGYNFHSAGMPVVATGCVGTLSCEGGQSINGGTAAVCDKGNGICRTDATSRAPLSPADVYLDPKKHYFLSVMPGDGINPSLAGAGGPVTDAVTGKIRQFDPAKDCPTDADYLPGSGKCGHNMGGAPIAPQHLDGTGTPVPRSDLVIKLAQTPLPTAKIAVLVYEDDYPLNGENDAGGGVDIVAPNEAGLGGFQIELLDQAGGLGDSTGQITYDMFNMPVSNSLAGTPDPMNGGQDACPITSNPDNIVGMIVTCPKYEADGKTISPLAGQAVIQNLYPGIYEISAFPAADRIARGEEWLQTNTLDGGKPHEAFIRPGEPSYFQEFGPGGFHVQIGFANPKIINDRRHNGAGTGICDPVKLDNAGNNIGGGGLVCNNTLYGQVHGNHMSRTPDQRTYDSGSYDAFSFSQCYVSLGLPDDQDFSFAKCDSNGNFVMTGLPNGIFKVAVFDQWNDIMLDGLITSLSVNGNTGTKDNPIALTATQWRTNLYTRTYLDTLNGQSNGIPDRDANGNDLEQGLALVPINIRYRDGSKGFANTTDLNGYATYNEVFPFMNWLVVEPDSTRFKPTGQHVVYDAGGPDDCSPDAKAAYGGNGHCSNTAANLAGTVESNSVPLALRVPGAVYCSDADCSDPMESILLGAYYTKGADTSKNRVATTGLSSGRIDPPWRTEAWQGLLGQHSFIDFGMKPFAKGENGGIMGLVVYASTRPYDDPIMDTQLQWEPAVPNVQVNLYQEVIAADGSKTLKLVDSTQTSSWDAWAQGFRTDGKGTGALLTINDGTVGNANIPNMNCPGQDPTSGFFATLQNSKMWLDTPDSTGNKKTLAYKSQFKCYDGWSQLNQIQPAPYDGKYTFPSVVDMDPVTGRPTKTNCSICVANPDDGNPMLPAGKYVVEVVPPPGFEIVKEEDKNILFGDIYIAPVTQQFAGTGNVFILPDQAAINAYYNAANPVMPNTNLGVVNPRGDFASETMLWPCVGQMRVVPDYMSLFPTVGEAAPFAGATRPLCDRKEISLVDEQTSQASFFVFTKNHIAGHFTGSMTNDMASEFDPFSPQFGEKFGVPNLPVRMRDFTGDEVTRVYGDQWGVYNGLYFSSWEVNPPNPTGYAPQMSVACMNDPGPIVDEDPTSKTYGQTITDPAYNPAYSNFCYETPFMPGFTAYMDTPVTPVQAFADHYNLPDSEYPDGTPVIKRADFKGNGLGTGGAGPWSPGSAGVGTVSVTASGSGYTGIPTVAFSGGNGSGTVATATMGVGSVNVTSASGSYRNLATPTVTFSAPPCTINGTTCVQAKGTAQMSSNNQGSTTRRVTGISFTNGFGQNGNTPGAGYTAPPTVMFSTGPATATTTLGVVAVSVTTPGSGYSGIPTVAFNGAGGSGAKATASLGSLTASLPLTLTAYGDRVVQNPQFTGPSATSAPYNLKTITRHYGFGAYCSATDVSNHVAGCATASTVTVGGIPATVAPGDWLDGSIKLTVPAGLAPCPVQQHGASATVCGEVVITASNGKQSIDGITVTIGGNTPKYVSPSSPTSTSWGEFYPNPLQTALDAVNPGDMLIVDEGTYRENVIMWKPVRLQGVGAGAVTINADAQPAGKMDAWRMRVSCLFGLNIQGVPNVGNSSYDPSAQFSCPSDQYFRADRIPFEGFVGWDASSNGNLAQVLQEPSLMGAYEGAGITVVGRGVNQKGSRNSDLWGQTGGAGTFPDGSRYVNASTAPATRNQPAGDCTPPTAGGGAANVDDYYTSNFLCNPSAIDGVSILNSSQGGGGIFLHGWNHNMQIANTRISANAGTLSGAINLGNGETPPAYTVDNTICGNTGVNPTPLCPPSVPNAQLPNVPATVLNGQIPFQFNTNVHIHHNQILNNASIGDALFSGSPAGAGGVTISAGSDNYELDHNWIAANLTSSDGGGIAQMGVSFNGKIHNNFVLFNQANNPTLPVDGGGIVIMGAQEDRTLPNGQECGGSTDTDCPPGIGDGTGPGLVIDSNLILGNSAEDGSGGGLRLRQTNGNEIGLFLTHPEQWYGITVTNNIIANNVAGWDGGGVSLQDSFKTVFVNNTVASNDTTASAGVLFKTLGAINAASPPPGCIPTPDPTQPQNPNCLLTNGPHIPQPAGLVTMQNTPNMMALFTGKVLCPTGFGYGDAQDSQTSRTNGRCLLVSLPQIANDLFWQNRAFHVEIVDSNGVPVNGTSTPNGTGLFSHQNIVKLLPEVTQAYTGQCVAAPLADYPGATTLDELYWDLGVRMDLLPNKNGHALVFNQATVGTTYGVTPGAIPAADVGPVALTATNSIFSDSLQTLNVLPNLSTGSTTTPNFAPAANPVQGQYCNGARIPPEQCSTGQGANNPAMCAGYFTPAGQSETVGVSQVFVFNGIAASATVDEGNNWINMSYGPLSLARPPQGGAPGATPSAEPTVASAVVAAAQGAYTINGDSAAVGAGTRNVPGVPGADFFGQTRPATGVSIGAVEYIPLPPTLSAITPASGQAGTTVPVILTGTQFTNGSTVTVSGTGVTVTGVTRVNSTTLNANFVITANAAQTLRTVTVSTAGGTTGTVNFTVTAPPPPPTVTSFTCSAAATGPNGCSTTTALIRGDTVTVTLAGANLTGAAVNVAGGGLSGVTVSNVAVNAAGTQLTATFAVSQLSLPGNRTLTVTTPAGTSAPATAFSLVSPSNPTVTSVTSSASGGFTHGTTVTATINGSGFTLNGTTLGVTCPTGTAGNACRTAGVRVTVSNVTVVSGTQITATFNIAANATLGARTVTVMNPNLFPTATGTFTVN